jgi:hypothetical protein
MPDVFSSFTPEPPVRLLIGEPTAEIRAPIYSLASKRSLAYAASECEAAKQNLISQVHMLVGIYREQPQSIPGEPGLVTRLISRMMAANGGIYNSSG